MNRKAKGKQPHNSTTKQKLGTTRKSAENIRNAKRKKPPLPMKLRALPSSFWQQPNNTPSMPPGSEFLTLNNDDVILECNNNEENIKENKIEMVTNANTALLFSLFQGLDNTDKSKPRRRGRPKKSVMIHAKVIRDDDPYLASNVTETLQRKISQESIQNQKTYSQRILAMVANDTKSPTLLMQPSDNPFSKILSDLVVQL